MIKLSSLKLNDKNPRFIKDDKFLKLVQSIKEDPELLSKIPLKVDFSDEGKILGGNMRFRALKELGIKEVNENCVIDCSDLTEDQKQKLVIIDNSTFGAWDFDMLANDWSENNLGNWGVDVPIFDLHDVKANNERESKKESKEVTCPHCLTNFLV